MPILKKNTFYCKTICCETTTDFVRFSAIFRERTEISVNTVILIASDAKKYLCLGQERPESKQNVTNEQVKA